MSWEPGTPVELWTEDFHIRSLKASDITQKYADWWSDPRIMAGIARPLRKMTVEQHRQRIARQFDNHKSFHLGYFDRRNGLLVGFLTIFYQRYHRKADLNTVIGDRDYWGRNVILGNCEPAFEFIFDTLGAEKISGQAVAKNLSTIFVNKSLGFKVEGVLRKEWRYEDGQRVDVIQFGMLPEDWRTRPLLRKKGKMTQ